jgi:DNA polymerase III subunit delta
LKEVDQILLDLKRKIYKPVYFLSGEEPYFIDMISDQIEHGVLEASEREFNQSVVYGKDADLAGVVGLARQFPMMSEYKVVIVKEAQNIKEFSKTSNEEDKDEKKSSAKGSEMLLQYINNPPPGSILVFCYKYKTLDKRSSLAKAIQKKAVYLETKKLYDNQLPDWVNNYVKSKNYKISAKASFLISEYLGNDLSKMANEVNKLFINLPEGSEIGVEHVQENIGISHDYNVFELQSAFSARDVLKANKIINYFAANEKENSPIMVLSTLYGYFCKVLKYQFLKDKNKYTAAQALGVAPYFIDGIASAAQYYNANQLKKIFSYLKEYDLKCKGVENSGISSGELMRELVFKIMH